MLLDAILVTFVGALLSIEQYNGQFGFSRPLIAGTIIGFVLGDLQMGLILGAEMQLIFMGSIAMGAAVPPDYLIGTVVATALAIMTGQSVEIALSLALPAAILGQSANILGRTVNTALNHWADKGCEAGNYRRIEIAHYMGGLVTFVRTALAVFPAVYFGSEAVNFIIHAVPEWVLSGLSAAGSILPVVGLGMLLVRLDTKWMRPFFFIGFALSVFGGFSMVGTTMLAVCIALLIDHYAPRNQEQQGTDVLPDDDLDELMK